MRRPGHRPTPASDQLPWPGVLQERPEGQGPALGPALGLGLEPALGLGLQL